MLQTVPRRKKITTASIRLRILFLTVIIIPPLSLFSIKFIPKTLLCQYFKLKIIFFICLYLLCIFCFQGIFFLFQSNNRMKSSRIIIIIHLHVAVVFLNGFADTLYSKTMFVFVGFRGEKFACLFGKWIVPTGIYHCDYNKWRFLFSGCIYFNV